MCYNGKQMNTLRIYYTCEEKRKSIQSIATLMTNGETSAGA